MRSTMSTVNSRGGFACQVRNNTHLTPVTVERSQPLPAIIAQRETDDYISYPLQETAIQQVDALETKGREKGVG